MTYFYAKDNYFCFEAEEEPLGSIRIIEEDHEHFYFCVVDLANVLMYRQVKWILEKYRSHIKKFVITNYGNSEVAMNFIDMEGAMQLVARSGDKAVYEWLFGGAGPFDEDVSCGTNVPKNETATNPEEPALSLESCAKLLHFAKFITKLVSEELDKYEIADNEDAEISIPDGWQV